MTATETPLDPEKIQATAMQMNALYTGALLTYLVDIGNRTGLFAAMAAAGPQTTESLAARAGLTERYVREWLYALTTGGVVDYDGSTQTFSLSPERAAFLTDGPMNMAPISQMLTGLGKHVHQIARVFREGGGVPYAEYRPDFTDAMDALGRPGFDHMLVDVWLALVPGLRERLELGIRVADVACGSGHALVVLARAFPNSSFVGYDLDDMAIARARGEAAGAGLSNVRFEIADVARLDHEKAFDLVFVFDAIHDQIDPQGVLARIYESLDDGGVFMMREPHAADRLEDNIGNPFAPVMYSISTLHCLTVSLAHGGAGIGTAFGEELARSLLTGAGFGDVEVHPVAGDPMDAFYIVRKARS